MRSFDRSDLGRLWISPAGARRFTYLGDVSLDSVAGAGAVTYNGRSYGLPSTGKSWTGTLTARAGEALLAASREFGEVDLMVAYGDESCSSGVGASSFTAANLIEGAVIGGEQWNAMTTLTSATRAPIAAICQFMARRVHRLAAGNTMRLHATVTGSVVALHRAGSRLYALCAAPSGGGTVILLRLAWCDDGYNWQSASISYGVFNEPTSYTLSYNQFALHAWIGDVYIATGNNLLRVAAPAVGAAPTALSATAVRPVGVTSAAAVGLAAYGNFLYVLINSGGLWRINASGGIGILPLIGSDWRRLIVGAAGLIARRPSSGAYVSPGVDVRVVDWPSGDLVWLGGAPASMVAITNNGTIFTSTTPGVWQERFDLAGTLIAAAESGGVIYAIASSGSRGSRLWASAGDPERWVVLDGGIHDPICLIPLGDGVVVGGQDLATSANRSSGMVSITRCRATGLIWQAASSDLLIAARAGAG